MPMICFCVIIQKIILAFLLEKGSEVGKSVSPTFKSL